MTVQSITEVSVATGSHVGLVHHVNEDNLAVFTTQADAQILAVCDGMGGMGRGDEASAIAVQVLQERLSDGTGFAPELMTEAVQAADIEIRRRLAVPGNTPGSTAVLATVDQGLAHVVWAGDSRAYWIREGQMIERTRDHKLVNELVDAGELTEAEAKVSALSHVVTKALGGRGPGEPTIVPQAMTSPWKLHTGDVLLLCSDGLCDLASDEEVAKLADQEDLQAAVRDLTQLALDRGGHDNITIVVARWEGASFSDEELDTPVITSPRTLTPTPALTHPRRNTTWDEIDTSSMDLPVEQPEGEPVPETDETVKPDHDEPDGDAESAEPEEDTRPKAAETFTPEDAEPTPNAEGENTPAPENEDASSPEPDEASAPADEAPPAADEPEASSSPAEQQPEPAVSAAPRQPADEEQPQVGMAVAVAVGAALLIALAFLAAQGVFG